ncbi:MAG: hypothetical protein GVY23_07970 [Spirochaetes bacterium]|nr:hypothetical protein [Spirochaetota bacterium]
MAVSAILVVAVLLSFVTASCEDLAGGGGGGDVGYDHSSTTIDTIFIGDRLYTSNWRTVPFDGSGHRMWNDDGRSFSFEWNTISGDQIGRIGRSVDSDSTGSLRLHDIPEDYVISANAELSSLQSSGGGWYIWAVYGWTHRDDVSWPITGDTTDEGWDNEFYIVFATNLPYLDPPEAGYVSDGTHDIEGTSYDFYHNDMDWGAENQTQWMAVAQSQSSWPGAAPVSIDVGAFLERWVDKNNIPETDYLVDLTLAVEAFGPSSGSLTLSDIVIP